LEHYRSNSFSGDVIRDRGKRCVKDLMKGMEKKPSGGTSVNPDRTQTDSVGHPQTHTETPKSALDALKVSRLPGY
jgi:hypothetical protein